MSVDVLLDPATGDLPDYVQVVGGMAIIAQRVDCRLRTVLGDWPLDTTAGIDWFGFLGRKPPQVDRFAASLVVEILNTQGVVTVENLSSEMDGNIARISMDVIVEDDGSGATSFPVVVKTQDETGNLSIAVGGVIGHSLSVVY